MNFVKLICYSNIDNKDITDSIAYIARVSNPTNQINNENNEKLIKYLIKHQHWSPFEMVNITLEINSTRDIIRQILRHRSFSFQEFSQRYANINELDIPVSLREARLQDNKNRQNSIITDDKKIIDEWDAMQNEVMELTSKLYDKAINMGIAKEQARVILPEGLTPSRIYMQGSVRSWIHYIQLRSKNDVQYEHRIIALECAEVIKTIFPMIKEFV